MGVRIQDEKTTDEWISVGGYAAGGDQQSVLGRDERCKVILFSAPALGSLDGPNESLSVQAN